MTIAYVGKSDTAANVQKWARGSLSHFGACHGVVWVLIVALVASLAFCMAGCTLATFDTPIVSTSVSIVPKIEPPGAMLVVDASSKFSLSETIRWLGIVRADQVKKGEGQ